MLNTLQKVKEISFKRVKSFRSFNYCNRLHFCNFCIATFVTLVTIYTFVTSVVFAGISDTKHDLSSTSIGADIKATEVTQKCVFCHTPHSASKAVDGAPLWNHSISSATYSVRSEASGFYGDPWRVTQAGQPDKGAKLCLGCHDGTVALGLLVNIPGPGMGGTVVGLESPMPCDLGDYSCLGTNFVSGGKHLDIGWGDHLVSIEYDDDLVAEKDAKCAAGIQSQGLVAPSTLTGAVRRRPTDHDNALYGNPKSGWGVQCRSCHDPHNDPGGNNSFLVIGTPADWNPLCETCHYNRSCPP